MAFSFTGFGEFHVLKDETVEHRFLVELARRAKSNYIRGMNAGKSGRIYKGYKQSSAGGEYPANQSGAYKGSIGTRVRAHQMEVGAGVYYAAFTSDGTSRMSPRKSSRHALEEALPETEGMLDGFVRFSRG